VNQHQRGGLLGGFHHVLKLPVAWVGVLEVGGYDPDDPQKETKATKDEQPFVFFVTFCSGELGGDFGNRFEEAEQEAALDGVVDPECFRG
jgi:hypothetical protein